ncbi:META domain-containing protein [Psychrobacter sp. F1192]|uniref:META domain-containing protein n=1 Tax=Psychrobacter coccoides TaxID=2818440 RepID=A0ABS3NKD5_9GAMM|nr:META domain-containing protein [Psychrobacter coccoides]MBO1529793.1 META domain-containing protein [Psychrobacter coccoides]
MTLIRLISPLLTIGLLSSVVLLGCQSTSLSSTVFTNPAVDNENWSTSTPKPRLFQTITKYQWQLTHVTDESGQIQPFNHKPPLIMQVRPDILLFEEGCHRYQGTFKAMRPLPYPYSLPDIRDLPDDCIAISHPGSDLNKGDIQRALEIVFAPYSDSYFKFDPILPSSPLFSKKASKQLALKTDKGKMLIFSGAAMPKRAVSGLPITNEILERYQWHLISATDHTNKSISELNHPNAPITASFDIDSYNHSDYQQGAFSQSVGFFTGCNGVGGSYALSSNQTLLIGASPSTLMGCGDLVNGIEDYLDRIMHNSSSQLTLTHPDITSTSNISSVPIPGYLLTQELDSGKTLIWKNEIKKTP